MHRTASDPEVRSQKILLIGFQDQDNLGLRYLMSAVNESAHRAGIMSYGSDPGPILDLIRREKPDAIGFSLIFQYMASEFARVIAALREEGVTAHITMGGHYPSFEFERILETIPGLDSVVRFDGEVTLVELLDHLGAGADWRTIDGVAYRTDAGEVRTSSLRRPVADLDTLPPPDRESIDYESHPMATASILGSRGCPWNCSFCSIRPFYEVQGGELRRLRSPRAVADEMIGLHHERGVPLFLFQDDDFLATGRRARRWAGEIADLIVEAGLAGKIAFKISCRSDEIREDTMERLVAGGLTHVYMGVESGEERGLLHMNKKLKPETHLEAGRILRKFDLSFDFGFMLLEPHSTLETVRANVDFLDEFIGDGWSVAPFCRMLPYAGTPIARQLEEEGRLLGTPFEPDYNFLDPKLDIFYDWMLRTFRRRNFTSDGLCHILRILLFEARLKLPGRNPVTPGQRDYLHHLTAVCNRVACYTLRAAVDHLESTPLERLEKDSAYLDGLTENELLQEARLEAEAAQYYEMVHRDHGQLPGPVTGGFDKTWTFRESELEATGTGGA